MEGKEKARRDTGDDMREGGRGQRVKGKEEEKEGEMVSIATCRL